MKTEWENLIGALIIFGIPERRTTCCRLAQISKFIWITKNILDSIRFNEKHSEIFITSECNNWSIKI